MKKGSGPILIQKLFDQGTTRVLLLEFKEGQMLKDHKTTGPALLYCISGSVAYIEATAIQKLKPGDFYTIKPGVVHRVEALAESRLLLVRS